MKDVTIVSALFNIERTWMEESGMSIWTKFDIINFSVPCISLSLKMLGSL